MEHAANSKLHIKAISVKIQKATNNISFIHIIRMSERTILDYKNVFNILFFNCTT